MPKLEISRLKKNKKLLKFTECKLLNENKKKSLINKKLKAK